MTEWQWQVILALIRMVLEINHHQSKDESLLREALARDIEYQKEYPYPSK